MSDARRIIVRNPNSGDRKRSKRAAEIGEQRGYEVWNSTKKGETHTLAKEAAEEADMVVACGGDGTLNEVVRGVDEANALSDVEMGVVPAGTGNDFADNIGIKSVPHAFEVLDSKNVRSLDLGWAEERPFINSCVAGVTAEASAATTPQQKRRLGVMAYVLNTLEKTQSFDGLKIDVRASEGGDVLWSGEAIMILIGNGRRFPGEQVKQANMEDGLMNVVIIKRAPTLNYLTRGAADRLLQRGASHLTRIKVPQLRLTHEGDPVHFSLDGEMLKLNKLSARSRRGEMRFHVGPTYDPNPEEWGTRPNPKGV
ncbi:MULTISPECIES: diacylglycerol kinase family protein [unclassified Haladaptatus]|uniref:diacylglycerol/lipid kinase family protein n=1 Tax=unclassified Haladaptatus TaxID=2622732 RepID=UPI0023E88C9A|nr:MULTISPECIES: YegS/Rv2252/BmrU family lipid kinase [unclassified Haladaptatus]